MQSIAIVSWLIGSVAFSAFTVFAIVNWWRAVTGRAVLLASLLTLGWLAAINWLEQLLASGAESLMLLGWLFLLWQALAIGNERRSMRRSPLKLLGVVALASAMLNALQMFGRSMLLDGAPLLIDDILLLVTNITGLMLVEQLTQNARADLRWRIRYLSIACSVIFAYGVLLHGLNIAFQRALTELVILQPAVMALTTPLLVIASLRNRQNKLKFNLSRAVSFRSGVLATTGIFLILLSLLSYLSQVFAGDVGLTIAVFLCIVILIGGAILIGSSEFRATVRVQFAKAFFAYRYDYREEWMQLTRHLTEVNADFDLAQQVQRGFLSVIQAPASCLFILDADRTLRCVSRISAADWNAQPSSALNDLLIAFYSQNLWVLDLQEAPETAEEIHAVMQKEMPEVRFLVPLILNNELFGLCMISDSAALEHNLAWEDYDILKLISAQATSVLALNNATESLVEHEKFAAVNQMSSFLVHDIKTITAQLSLLVENAATHSDKPEFVADMVETTRNSVQRMQKIIQGLQQEPEHTHVDRFDLSASLQHWLSETHPARERIRFEMESGLFVEGTRADIMSALNHIIQNSLEASEPESLVHIALQQHEHSAYITVTDNGPGMSAEFISTQLFKPFKSDKGVTGMGIGAYQAKALLQQNGGEIHVRSELGHGSTFTIRLPLSKVN